MSRAPSFTMNGSIFRIRPIKRADWIAVVVAFVAEVAMIMAACGASHITDDPTWAYLTVVGFALVLAVLALVIATKTPRGSRSMLSISNLSVTEADKPILKGLTLEAPAGEVHAIMGPNGADR